jgi:hypothetical protein
VSSPAELGRRSASADRDATAAAHVDVMGRRRRARVPLMALGMLSLVAALAGGLARLGWSLPVAAPLVAFHGPLMVAGFLGTVISLERAVALGRAWAYGAPIASGLGALALATGGPGGPELMLLGSVVMVAAFVAILRRQAALFTVVMALGALCWVIGQALWLAGQPMHRVVWWGAGFLVLTIVGERLDLSRLQRPTATSRLAFVAAAGVLLVGLGFAALAPHDGVRLVGAGFVALAAWLGAFDVARRTVRGSGLTRFIAVALLSGYAWLAVAGLLLLRWPHVAAGAQYDAILHALFVGFVFSMIFGHAPIIFPAVLGVRVAYRPIFYLPLGLLHASLVLRIVGDVASWLAGRQWGGLLNALAIVLFFAVVVYGVAGPRPRV